MQINSRFLPLRSWIIIIDAINEGYNYCSVISRKTEITKGHIFNILDILEETGFIKRFRKGQGLKFICH